MNQGGFLKKLEATWGRSGMALWALASALLLAFLSLEFGRVFDPEIFTLSARSAVTWLLPAGVGLLALALFQTADRRLRKTVRFVPRFDGSFLHISREVANVVATVVHVRCDILNLTGTEIYLAEVRLVSPVLKGETLQNMISVEDYGDNMLGRNVLAPDSVVDALIDVVVRTEFAGRPGGTCDLQFKVADQFGRWYPFAMTDVRIT